LNGDVETEGCGSQEHQEGRRSCEEAEDDLAPPKEDPDSSRQGRSESSSAEAPREVIITQA
jgi:hypothetical protein